MDRKCEGCKWYRDCSFAAGDCANPKVAQMSVNFAKSEIGDCGPSGRYWEPREEEE